MTYPGRHFRYAEIGCPEHRLGSKLIDEIERAIKVNGISPVAIASVLINLAANIVVVTARDDGEISAKLDDLIALLKRQAAETSDHVKRRRGNVN